MLPHLFIILAITTNLNEMQFTMQFIIFYWLIINMMNINNWSFCSSFVLHLENLVIWLVLCLSKTPYCFLILASSYYYVACIFFFFFFCLMFFSNFTYQRKRKDILFIWLQELNHINLLIIVARGSDWKEGHFFKCHIFTFHDAIKCLSMKKEIRLTE